MHRGKDLFIFVSQRGWFCKQKGEGPENPKSKQRRWRHTRAVFSDTAI